ncbi:uncharacterized protein AMSG_09337 [Thecamonas trahens ATCC 50062]|uniref:Calcineurin-like phosphoesterase domain-containing protein n=1 Tax=Thecamonas trahens ATCC 50062 TaxID=461836 RepID=A0A0L0DL20_THETB|nr:hypothetical protein AMSG_09337 [Thecamonas trahens ATCC 50062]KNC53044.1 hypothetical protein AMSG_09337 [Thecamonas trahens ATCC 50062]|eukprot:XP_013754722.1 hypothetical protein AMSG_09337 [Thecamonas trahens ATCC 50062]
MRGMRLLHLSDVHLNALFEAKYGSGTNCMAPKYHTPNAPPPPGPPPPPDHVAVVRCDTSPAVLTSALDAVNALDEPIDFVLLTGDLSAHGYVSSELALAAIANASAAIDAKLGQHPIVPTIGNDDCYPDYFLPLTPNAPWLAKLAEVWAPWLARFAGARDSFLHGGYFEAELAPSLRVLSLNTIYYSISHLPRPAQPVADPLGQFAWLEARLAAARAAGSYHIYLMGHIPPAVSEFQGSAMWDAAYADRYVKLVASYADVVAGQFFGHTHRDEFRLLFREESSVSSALIAGSLSMVFVNNPSFKVVDVTGAPESWIPTNLTAYYLDATNPAALAPWRPEYVFSNAYPPASPHGLSPAGLLALYGAFPQYPDLVTAFSGHRWADYVTADTPEGFAVLCSLATASITDYSECVRDHKLPMPHPLPATSASSAAAPHGRKDNPPVAVVAGIVAGTIIIAIAVVASAFWVRYRSGARSHATLVAARPRSARPSSRALLINDAPAYGSASSAEDALYSSIPSVVA